MLVYKICQSWVSLILMNKVSPKRKQGESKNQEKNNWVEQKSLINYIKIQ